MEPKGKAIAFYRIFLVSRFSVHTVSQIFILQQFSIVISHCSVVGRHVNGVGVTFLWTTYVFLMRGRIGLYTCRIELTIMNTNTRDTTTPTDTKIAVLFIEDSPHEPLNRLPNVDAELVPNGNEDSSVAFRLLQLEIK